ncbi:putative transcriptional regulator [Corynebacterium kutscheri]|nr:putative transcriptional regulator [Corynebacterium kutscheri]
MAETIGLSTHTLRYWEQEGLIEGVQRNSGNQRRYRTDDIEWVRFLLRLKETGMHISQMRRYAKLRKAGTSTLIERRDMLIAHRQAILSQIAKLNSHKHALDSKISIYDQMITNQQGDTYDPH